MKEITDNAATSALHHRKLSPQAAEASELLALVSGESFSTGSGIVRVAVFTEAKLTDLALPTGLPIRDILPAVERLLAGPDEGLDADKARQPGSALLARTLAPIGGAPFSLDATLDTVGVVDGDLLALCVIPPGAAAPGVVEDVADAAALRGIAQRPTWGIASIRRGAGLAALVLVLLATGLVLAHWATTRGRNDLALADLTALVGLAAAAVVASLVVTQKSPGKAAGPAVAALVPIIAALVVAVPGPFGAAHLTLAAAGVAAWAFINIIAATATTVTTKALRLFTALAVTGVSAAAAGMARMLVNLPTSSVGCVLVLLSALLAVKAATIAAFWARFPLPTIPAPGEQTPPAITGSVLADLPRRVKAAEAHQVGLIAAAVALLVFGGVLVVEPNPRSPWAWAVLVIATAAGALRARIWDSSVCKGLLAAAPHLVSAALLVSFLAVGQQDAALCALVAFAVLTLVWTVVAATPQLASAQYYSPPARRVANILAIALDVALLPAVGYFAGVFQAVLDR